jgi:hypothetical protein
MKPTYKPGLSALQVFRSAAGYYVGTAYTAEDGTVEPGSRDSDYFRTEAQAQTHLRTLTGRPLRP